ncbi:Peroxisomal membrane protein PAS20 [Ceratocystis pirilliformis]|uniref:Peroxisomal membrane protein PEX13 n=1 Tax=Ceratocystis pirilliformis TaxID=259994 RepID=A0ABR3ZF56_9PEZI
MTSTTTATNSSTTELPQLPARPPSLIDTINQNAATYSRIGGVGAATSYSPYGTGYQSPYASPYNRMGGMGSYGTGMYGGYGGTHGSGMYGAGGMYGNGMGGMMNPADTNSLANRFSQSTQATFQMLEGIVGAFGGFAQMLESTYMATHSSFFAMISVAEQFGNLRDTLGSLLGVFAIVRWVKTMFAKLTGCPLPADASSLTPAAFARFEGRNSPAGGSGPTRASRKPLMFFVLAAFGLPYLMNKLIKAVAERDERKRLAMGQGALVHSSQQPDQQQVVDASELEFCRVMFDFVAKSSGDGALSGVDLEVHKGDIIAVLSKTDPFGNPSEWWRCRARDGRLGYLPSTYLQTVRKPGQAPVKAIAPSPPSDSSRTNSMSSSIASRMSTSLKSDISKATTIDTDVKSDESYRILKGL